MKTGLVIKELRIKKGLTQEELADLTELSARTIQRIENGEVDPRSYSLQMIAKALDVDFSLFIEDESTEDKENKEKDDRLILGMIHLSGSLLLFFPTVLIRNNKKGKVNGLSEHFNEVISFQLTIWVMFILPGLLIYYFQSVNNFMTIDFFKGPILTYLGVLFGVLYSTINTISVINGKPYKRFNIINKKKNKKVSL